MKKILALVSPLLIFTGVKAQNNPQVKKETAKPEILKPAAVRAEDTLKAGNIKQSGGTLKNTVKEGKWTNPAAMKEGKLIKDPNLKEGKWTNPATMKEGKLIKDSNLKDAKLVKDANMKEVKLTEKTILKK